MSHQIVMSKEVSRKFSFFMLIFIFIVVLFHSDFRYFYPFIEDLTAVSTAYFFCASAFFFCRGLSGKNSVENLKKRCVTLLLPYFLWNLIYMILYFRADNFTFSGVIKGFTVNPICAPTWYLLTLFIFFVFVSLTKRMFCKTYLTVAVFLAGVLISYLGYIRFQQELATIPVVGGYLIRMAEYFTPFLIGAVVGNWFEEKIYVGWKNCVVGGISSVAILVLLLWGMPTEVRWFLWVLLPLTLWEAIPEKIFTNAGLLQVLTEPAFFINMVHCCLLVMWKAVMGSTGFVTGKHLAAVNVILTLAVSYGLYYLLRLLMPGTIKVLTGNRSGND